MPAMERTEGEKIRLARLFLEKRGFVVLPDLISKQEIALLLRCSSQHVTNLMEATDFPAPFDLNAGKTHIDNKKIFGRWSASQVLEWVESRQVSKSSDQE